MEKKLREQDYCSNCELKVDEDSDFCPRCGALFVKGIKCTNHPSKDADRVCVICSEPFCNICGSIVSGIFLCAQHDFYEIYDGMARVYGSSDFAQVNFIKECLEKESLHPFIYSRKASPMHLGGSDYSLFRASGDFEIINEVKLMVPCSEVLSAEKIINDLEV